MSEGAGQAMSFLFDQIRKQGMWFTAKAKSLPRVNYTKFAAFIVCILHLQDSNNRRDIFNEEYLF